MAFTQYYQAGDTKFYNLFRAFDHYKQHNKFVEYVIDPEFVGSLQNIKRPNNLTATYVKKLMIKGLKNLRSKHNKIRLAFGGGTDSWTILKLCVENDIHVDELVCGVVSFNGNVRSDIEYLPALRYAKQHEGQTIGEVIVERPTEQSLDFINDPHWFKETNGPCLPIRPFYCQLGKERMNDPSRGFITITGMEKPIVQIKNGQPYWTQVDLNAIAEWMGIDNHYPLFYDKENPELTVAMEYSFLDAIPRHMKNTDGMYGYDTIDDRNVKDKILDALGIRVERPWLNYHFLGKKPYDFNIKTKYFIKEIKAMGMGNYLDKWYASMQYIYDTYKHIPHSVTMKDNRLKTVGRFSQSIPIHNDKFGKIQTR
tara:strand:+ start:3971 stop:5074 length:1104 start_codon:yes stop_codon:yes gene_type:complete